MRNKKMYKKLDLNKVTIANLEMKDIRAGFDTLLTDCDCDRTNDAKCLTENPIYCVSESCG